MLRYAITDRTTHRPALPWTDPFDGLVEQARLLADYGVDFLQLREKDLEAKQLIGLTRRIITAVGRAGEAPGRKPRVLVNGRADVALAAGADGIHLPSGTDQMTVAQAHRVFGAKIAIVSIACHTLREVESASREGADLILFSPVFEKVIAGGSHFSGKHFEREQIEPAGLAQLAEACHAAGATPVLALGGVTDENAQRCVEAGAKGVAGIRLFQPATPARLPAAP